MNRNRLIIGVVMALVVALGFEVVVPESPHAVRKTRTNREAESNSQP